MVLPCYRQRELYRSLDCLKPSRRTTWWRLTSLKRELTTGRHHMPTMCSPLEHTEYLLLQTDLQKEKVLGPFDQVCLYIFDLDIKVNMSIGYL